MLARMLMIVAVLFVVSACSTTEDQSSINEAERETISEGPLGEIYGQDVQGPAPGTQADLVVNVGDRIFFGYDRFDLTPEAQDVLNAQANWLQRYPNLNIIVEGHCDERGTREYNLALGERRANSIKNYLVARGVSVNRVQPVSFGKERPAVPGSNEAAWGQNRRGVTKVE